MNEIKHYFREKLRGFFDTIEPIGIQKDTSIYMDTRTRLRFELYPAVGGGFVIQTTGRLSNDTGHSGMTVCEPDSRLYIVTPEQNLEERIANIIRMEEFR